MRPSSSMSNSPRRCRTPQPAWPDAGSLRQQQQPNQPFSTYELHDSCVPGPGIHVDASPQSGATDQRGGNRYDLDDAARGDVFLPSLPAAHSALKHKHAPPPLLSCLSSPSLTSLSRRLDQLFPLDVDGSELPLSSNGAYNRLPPISSSHSSPTYRLAQPHVDSDASFMQYSPSHMLTRNGYGLYNLTRIAKYSQPLSL